MKYRLDYVTNSSSSSYILALYSEKPDYITSNTYDNAVTYMLKELSDCKLSSIVDTSWGSTPVYSPAFIVNSNPNLRTRHLVPFHTNTLP